MKLLVSITLALMSFSAFANPACTEIPIAKCDGITYSSYLCPRYNSEMFQIGWEETILTRLEDGQQGIELIRIANGKGQGQNVVNFEEPYSKNAFSITLVGEDGKTAYRAKIKNGLKTNDSVVCAPVGK